MPLPSTATQIIVAMQLSLVVGVLLGLLLVRGAKRRAALREKREADTVDPTEAAPSPPAVPAQRTGTEPAAAAVPDEPDGAAP